MYVFLCRQYFWENIQHHSPFFSMEITTVTNDLSPKKHVSNNKNCDGKQKCIKLNMQFIFFFTFRLHLDNKWLLSEAQTRSNFRETKRLTLKDTWQNHKNIDYRSRDCDCDLITVEFFLLLQFISQLWLNYWIKSRDLNKHIWSLWDWKPPVRRQSRLTLPIPCMLLSKIWKFS